MKLKFRTKKLKIPCVTSNKFSEGNLSARAWITFSYLILEPGTPSSYCGNYTSSKESISVHIILFVETNAYTVMVTKKISIIKQKKKRKYVSVMHTSWYTRSTVVSTVPAGNIASSSDTLKPQFPSLGANSSLMASLLIISHNPNSIDTWKISKKKKIQAGKC